MSRRLNYDAVGATRPDDPEWQRRPSGYRVLETTVAIGHGQTHWDDSARAVLDWGVKTGSGFTVIALQGEGTRVREGRDYVLRARLGPVIVREPVRVVTVVEHDDRCGFAYGTLDGHPVRGEEAFVVHRATDGGVLLTLRSLTSAPRGPWLIAYPAALVAQRWYRRRYRRALKPGQN
jgi:uncharacterized protein (UPF0548 family)